MMLTKCTVENYTCFKDRITFDLGNINTSYDFSLNAVRGCYVNKGIIYGFNGCGKSNLGRAIMDITVHLTDWNVGDSPRKGTFLNLDSKNKYAYFCYDFLLPSGKVRYEYKKDEDCQIIFEKLILNDECVLEYDFISNEGFLSLENAMLPNFGNTNSRISLVKYIKSNSVLKNDVPQNRLFGEFVDFVDRMLLFYSLNRNSYIGFQSGRDRVNEDIVHKDVRAFSDFLKSMGLHMMLSSEEQNGVDVLMVDYKKGKRNFYSVVSTGTKSLALFYYWYTRMKNSSFVFIDEFDAFYHFELAEKIVKAVLSLSNVQAIFTTHNTDLLSNEILRPDCYFYMHENTIKKLSDCTEKDLRKAHNLQKLFKAGAFV